MRPRSTALPSFFVLGPPRTGTTWLYDVLSRHTNLPHPTKETRFFDVHFHRGMKWYQRHFPAPSLARATGEIAPTYFASSEARERIARVTPDAKLVIIFRHPVQRVVSLYRVKRAYGMLPWNIEQALRHDPELIGSGNYATLLAAWQRRFGRAQVLTAIFDDMQNDPQAFVNELARFIGIAPFALTPGQLARIHSVDAMTEPRNYLITRTASKAAEWLKSRSLDEVVAMVRRTSLMKCFLGGGPPFSEVSEEIAQSLCELFRPEVERLEAILGRDLSAWKTMEPDLTIAHADAA